MSFRFYFGLVFSIICLGSQVFAQEIALTVVDGEYKSGTKIKIIMFVGNDTDTPYVVPSRMQAYLKQADPYDYKALTLLYIGQDLTPLASGRFGTYSFEALIPEGLDQSYYELGLEDYSAQPVNVRLVSYENAYSGQEETVAIGEAANPVEEKTVHGVSPYKPIYFLFGNNPFDAKFQISLKYQLFNRNGAWAKEVSWLSGFHLGYTQVAFWDLGSASKPFEDMNFMPEAFYSLKDLKLGFLPDNSHADLQTGILHESNGRGGDKSRSLNIIYGRATYEQMIDEDWFFRLTGDVWRYVGSMKENPDIAEYRGYSSLGFTFGAKKGIQVSSYRRGKIGNNKGSYLFDVSLPIKRVGRERNFNFKLHGQLFTGYGENLLTYDQKETRLRLGIGIYR